MSITPGSWKVKGPTIQADGAVLFDGYLPFEAPEDKATAEMRANLRLAAAAPEMVELLRKAAKGLYSENQASRFDLAEDIEALLRRIEGEE